MFGGHWRGRGGARDRAAPHASRDWRREAHFALMKSSGFIGDSEATLRPSAGSGPQAIALETKQLSRSVAGKVLVSDISVRVQLGEVLAVVGPSGAGKSSFLRLLNRLDEPTGGAAF